MSATNTPMRPADMSMSPTRCANRRSRNWSIDSFQFWIG
jgi:hypothetical protein